MKSWVGCSGININGVLALLYGVFNDTVHACKAASLLVIACGRECCLSSGQKYEDPQHTPNSVRSFRCLETTVILRFNHVFWSLLFR